nr:hypothetical protein [Tanacetum cinerariifolium]
MGIVWRRLVSKVGAVMISYSLDGYLDGLHFGIGVSRGGKAILHAVNRLIEGSGDDVGLSKFLCIQAWYLDDDTIVGDTFAVGKPKEDPRSRLEGVFPYNISQTLHGVMLLDGPASVDFDFSSEIVMKRVAKTIELMDAVSWINDPQWFRDWQWRLATLPFAFGRLGVSPAGDVLNYAFLASQLQSASLQTKLLWHF